MLYVLVCVCLVDGILLTVLVLTCRYCSVFSLLPTIVPSHTQRQQAEHLIPLHGGIITSRDRFSSRQLPTYIVTPAAKPAQRVGAIAAACAAWDSFVAAGCSCVTVAWLQACSVVRWSLCFQLPCCVSAFYVLILLFALSLDD